MTDSEVEPLLGKSAGSSVYDRIPSDASLKKSPSSTLPIQIEEGTPSQAKSNTTDTDSEKSALNSGLKIPPRSNSRSYSLSKASTRNSPPKFPSIENLSQNPNTTINSFKVGNTAGNRTSVFSDYSGIVQQVDIDTIKFVGNKDSVQLSGNFSSSSSDHYIQEDNDASRLPKTPRALSKEKYPGTNALDSKNMANLIRKNTEHSPIKKTGLPLPESPLPKLHDAYKHPRSVETSPLKKRHQKSLSNASSESSKVHQQLDNIMKEVEDLQSVIDDDQLKKTGSKLSMASTNHSFHTADDGDSIYTTNPLLEPEEDGQKPEEDEETVTLKFGHTLDPSLLGTVKHESPLRLKNPKTESTKSHAKSTSSKSGKSRHSKSSSSHKSKRRSTSSRNSLKPFSYETLAKLLNATDGIIIGQEFATLNIPSEEKFLIERIVDSISRLTANMMRNPARYDQSCARLERVLNVLEGFD
ncbi:unnamed protein product [Pichia kudriavzevii]